MGNVFYRCCVLVLLGYLSISFVSGVEILEKGKLIFLKDSLLNLTCEQATNTDESQNLVFEVNGNSTIDAFSPERSYSGGKSRLFLHKRVTLKDTGSYICKFGQEQATVDVEVFEDTRAYDQKRYEKDSTDLTEGDTLILECPVLEALEATVTWSRVGGKIRDGASIQDIGNKIYNGRLTINDVSVDDNGYYKCSAVWYSGEITLNHRVRIKSKLAPLWPAIGIILEILVLVVIILACKDKRKKDEEPPLDSPATSGNAENQKGSRRKYATTST